MKHPLSRYNPVRSAALSLLTLLLLAAYLTTVYFLGIWRPSRNDFLGAAWGMALMIIGYIVPAIVAYGRDRDRYVRLWMAGKVPFNRHIGILVWAVAFPIVYLRLGPRVFPRVFPSPFVACYLAGALVTFSLAYYPHARAVWKRMRELYEQDQVAAPPVALPGPTGVGE